MALFLYDTFEALHINITPKNLNFRVLSLIFSLVCAVLLLIRNLKALSYVSLIKIGVFSLIFLISLSQFYYEIDTRVQGTKSRKMKIPLLPSVFGVMKSVASWETSYFFHVGVAGMYAGMERPSIKRWNKLSSYSVTIICVINIVFGLLGFLATTNMEFNDNKNLCTSKAPLYLVNYKPTPPVIFGQISIIIIMIFSYVHHILYIYILYNKSLTIIYDIDTQCCFIS